MGKIFLFKKEVKGFHLLEAILKLGGWGILPINLIFNLVGGGWLVPKKEEGGQEHTKTNPIKFF